MTLKDGLKYSKTFINLVFIFFIALFLSESKFIPFGAHPKTIKDIVNIFQNNFNPQYAQFIDDPNSKEKNSQSNLYPLIFDSIYKDSKNQKIVVLIVVESIGLVSEQKYENKIEQLFIKELNDAIRNSNNNKFKLSRLKNEVAPGGTLRMEYLNLCSQFKKEQKELFDNCLPNIIKQKENWTSIYMHSPSLSFYNRKNIMREIGFEELFSQRGKLIEDKDIFKQLKICLTRNFCAPPDSDLFKSGLKKIKENKSKNIFLNILTVDAHGPYRSMNIFRKTSEIDNYFEKVSISLNQVSNFIQNLLISFEKKDIDIFIVSDHPAILTSEDKEDYTHLNYSFRIQKK